MDLAELDRNRSSDLAGMTTEHLIGARSFGGRVISASVKPFTANFARKYGGCAERRYEGCQKP